MQAPIRIQRVQFAVANNEVNAQRKADNEQHGDKVGRNDRHAPVKQTEQAQHHHQGITTGYQGNNNPTQTTEYRRQNQQHNPENRAAKISQITFDKRHHVRRNHRHPADEQLGVITIARHDFAHVDYQQALSLKHDAGMRFVQLFRCLKLRHLRRRQRARFVLLTQRIPFLQQLVVVIVALEIDLDRGQLSVFTDQQVGVNGAGGEFGKGLRTINTLIFQTGQRVAGGDIAQADRRALKQRHIPYGNHRGNTL